MQSQDLAPVLVLFVFMFASAWIVWVVSSNRRRQRVAEIQKDMHMKLFEKFGTSQELLAYLQSDAGRTFMDSAAIECSRPLGRILGSIHTGLTLLFAGLGLLFLHGRLSQSWSEDTLVFGVLALALGIGFLLSAGVSYWLSKSWGILHKESLSQR
jgi:ABC-type multidrug transport system fused ATPase/permease subunit